MNKRFLDVNNIYDMIITHDNGVNNISELNSLHDSINNSKCIKTLILIISLSDMYVWINAEVKKV